YNTYPFSSPYMSMPTYQYQPISTGLLPLSTWTGSYSGLPAYASSGAPRMRQDSGVVTAGYQGTYVTASATRPVYTPLTCAALVGGTLNNSSLTYAPASYASMAVASVGPPPRMRQANYPDAGVRAANLSGSADGLEMRRAEVDVRLPS